MKKIQIDDCICHSKIKNHFKIKDDILSEIDKCDDDSLSSTDSYYSDSISKLDWSKSSDTERPWVKIFVPEFCEDIKEIISSMCYYKISIKHMWYQQYLEGDTHGWHIHGQHYTGVYYLEFSEGCSKTEICSPFNLNKKQIDVEEGDFILFPAHFIHRGLPNKTMRKTIVSFNFDVIANTNDGLPALNLNLLK
tara:strand:- start:587 stop:1165 length:579 start_codon:yes stop_codon:yes gene_type:complete